MSGSSDGKISRPLYVALTLMLAVVFSGFSLGVLFFCMPLLLLAPTFKSERNAVFCCVGTGIAIAVWTYIKNRNFLNNPEMFSVILLGFVLLVMEISGCAVWVGLRNFSNNVLRKLVVCSYVVTAIGVLFAMWFSVSSVEYLQRLLEQYMQTMFGSMYSGSEALMKSTANILICSVAPTGMAFMSLQILASEFIFHRGDKEWHSHFAYMKMPYSYVWFYIGLWIFLVFGRRFLGFPIWANVALWNILLVFSLHYVLSGISILMWFLGKKRLGITAGKIFFSVFVVMLVPILNCFVFITLLLLGLSENWIKLR